MNSLRQFKFWLACILMLPLLQACSSGVDLDTDLIPVKSGDRCGYINLKGEYVINPQFDAAAPFLGGNALVMKGEKCGYIDKKGQYIINPQYSQGTSFTEGLAWVVKKDGAPTLIDTDGEVIVELKEAETCYSFSDGLACVSITDQYGDTKYGYVNKKGKFVIQPKYDHAQSFVNGLAYVRMSTSDTSEKRGFIDKDNKWVITLPDSITAGSWPTFLCGQTIIHDKNYDYGLMDKSGKITVAPQFDNMDYDSKDMYVCKLNGSSDWGWCDQSGKIIINPQFGGVMPFGNNDLAPVLTDGDWGYIDRAGKIKINPQFDKALPFIDGKAAFVSDGKKFGIIDKDGKYIVNPQFDDIGREFYFAYIYGQYRSSVTTEFYDIDKAVAQLEKIVTEESADGITFDTPLEKILSKYGKEDMSVPYYSTTWLKVGEKSINNLFNYEVSVNGEFVERVPDGWWYTNVFNKQATPWGIQITVTPIGTGSGRGADLMKAYEKKLDLYHMNESLASGRYGVFIINVSPTYNGFTITLEPASFKADDYCLEPEDSEAETEEEEPEYVARPVEVEAILVEEEPVVEKPMDMDDIINEVAIDRK